MHTGSQELSAPPRGSARPDPDLLVCLAALTRGLSGEFRPGAFLDELSAAVHVRLLRVLQEREFHRVGGMATLKANVRLITAAHLPLPAGPAPGGSPVPASDSIEEVERAAILEALRATRGRKDLGAARLGLSRFQLYHRLKRYQIEPELTVDPAAWRPASTLSHSDRSEPHAAWTNVAPPADPKASKTEHENDDPPLCNSARPVQNRTRRARESCPRASRERLSRDLLTQHWRGLCL